SAQVNRFRVDSHLAELAKQHALGLANLEHRLIAAADRLAKVVQTLLRQHRDEAGLMTIRPNDDSLEPLYGELVGDLHRSLGQLIQQPPSRRNRAKIVGLG